MRIDTAFPGVRECRVVYSPAAQAGPLAHVQTPRDAAIMLMDRLSAETQEVVLIVLLTTKNRALAIHEIGRGTIDTCVVQPREVFKAAIIANAASVIVAHNHPSGDPTPSPDDVALCARLRAAGDLLGINIHDFLIIGNAQYFSMLEAGRFQS